jgi:hypothetical protein
VRDHDGELLAHPQPRLELRELDVDFPRGADAHAPFRAAGAEIARQLRLEAGEVLPVRMPARVRLLQEPERLRALVLLEGRGTRRSASGEKRRAAKEERGGAPGDLARWRFHGRG